MNISLNHLLSMDSNQDEVYRNLIDSSDTSNLQCYNESEDSIMSLKKLGIDEEFIMRATAIEKTKDRCYGIVAKKGVLGRNETNNS